MSLGRYLVVRGVVHVTMGAVTSPAALRPSPAAASSDRWAVILAGGDGMRLRSLTRRITGDERPKQFCPVIGGGTLLEQTWRRTSQVVPPERTLLVFTRRHERFYQPLVSELKARHVVAQPENCGTAAGILYPFLRLAALAPSPQATVAVFTSDQAGRPCIRSPASGRSRIPRSPTCSEAAAATGTASSWWRGCRPCWR